MEIFKTFSELKTHKVGAVTIGNFDGFHLGHQSLIHTLKKATQNQPCLLITFDPHPREVLNPSQQVPRLSRWEDLLDQFSAIGVDYVLRLQFTEDLKNTSAQDFMATLWSATQFTKLVVGHDFALGSQREGNGLFLSNWCQERNVDFVQVPPFEAEGETVSSQKIREAVIAGNMNRAAQFLGHPFFLKGKVMRGDARGRTLGFPTANIYIESRLIEPAQGVYGGKAMIRGKSYYAVCNIGRRPTFNSMDSETRIEIHLLDFSEDIYDELLMFEFHFSLRRELKFSSKEELMGQIQKDIALTRERFKI